MKSMLRCLGLVCVLILFGAGITALQAGEENMIRVKITVGEHMLYADFLDNATSRSLIAKFPLTLPMKDLYTGKCAIALPKPCLPMRPEPVVTRWATSLSGLPGTVL